MTSYFDALNTQIHNVDKSAHDAFEQLFAIDEQCVHDVSICAEWPGLPEWARDAIHHAVVSSSWASSSEMCQDGSKDDGPNDADAYVVRLSAMISQLHNVFHGIGTWAYAQPERVPFTDDPRTPINEHLAKASEARLNTARKLGLCLTRDELRTKRLANGWSKDDA